MLVIIDGDVYDVSYQQFLDLLEIIAKTGSIEAEGGGVFTNGKCLGGPAINLSCVNAEAAREMLGRNQRKLFIAFETSETKHLIMMEYMREYAKLGARYNGEL